MLFRSLLTSCLRILDAAKDPATPYLLVQFLWRYLDMSGTAPDPDECGRCGRRREEKEAMTYSRGTLGFLCSGCAGDLSGEASVPLSPGALGYLRYSGRVPVEKACEAVLDGPSLPALKRAVLFLIQDMAGGTLNSIRTGAGIL